MYLNWAHHYIPKVSGVCSVIVNFIFMYILQSDRNNKLGDYRYLLFFFAIFNLISTTGDVMVPMIVHDHRYAFSIFIVDGIFEQIPDTVLVSNKMFRGNFLTEWFIPYGLILTVAYCWLGLTGWFSACYFFLLSDLERSTYLRDSINATYHVDIFDLNILTTLYREGSAEAIRQSWIGLLIISFISVYSIIVYMVLGWLIIRKLSESQLDMSKKTLQMQRQLMLALAVQAIIPIFVSFLPCLVVLYQPVFNMDLGSWLSLTACVAISFFPVLDPLALLYVIPMFRYKIRKAVVQYFTRFRSTNRFELTFSRDVRI